jgi:hypothetical protein
MTQEETRPKRQLNIGKIDPEMIRSMYATAQQKAEVSRKTEQGSQYTELINQLLEATGKESDGESFLTLVSLARLTVPGLADDKTFKGSLSAWLDTNEGKKHFVTFNAGATPEETGKYRWVRKA